MSSLSLCMLCPLILPCFYSCSCPSHWLWQCQKGDEENKPSRAHLVLTVLCTSPSNLGSLVRDLWLSSHTAGLIFWAKCLLALLSNCCVQGLLYIWGTALPVPHAESGTDWLIMEGSCGYDGGDAGPGACQQQPQVCSCSVEAFSQVLTEQN